MWISFLIFTFSAAAGSRLRLDHAICLRRGAVGSDALPNHICTAVVRRWVGHRADLCSERNRTGGRTLVGAAVSGLTRMYAKLEPENTNVSWSDAPNSHRFPTAVAYPCEKTALAGAIEAGQKGLIEPILVGPVGKIAAIAKSSGIDLGQTQIIDAPDSRSAAAKAVELVRQGKAELLMKGSLHTDELLAAVVARDTGLRTGRRISHVFIMDVPTYHKVLIVTDAAINIAPTLEDKVDICQNAIDLAISLGLEQPKVAILAAVETVNSKMPATLDAAALCKMADRGQITGGLLDGPLAFDNAISKQAAETKGIRSEVAGDPDILLAPDLEAGNILAKLLSFLANADSAGLVLGARVPIILTAAPTAFGPGSPAAASPCWPLTRGERRSKETHHGRLRSCSQRRVLQPEVLRISAVGGETTGASNREARSRASAPRRDYPPETARVECWPIMRWTRLCATSALRSILWPPGSYSRYRRRALAWRRPPRGAWRRAIHRSHRDHAASSGGFASADSARPAPSAV